MGFKNPIQGIKDDISYIAKDVLGIKDAARDNVTAPILPWFPGDSLLAASDTPSISKMFPPIEIDAARWDQLYPYRILVIDTSKGNSIVGGDENQVSTELTQGNGDEYIVTYTPMTSQWLYQLPITPQQLSITDQFAIATSATLRGVVEEHNGVKFKMISASGSFGVWTHRETVVKSPTSPGLIRSLFGGTLDALSDVISSVTNTINALTTGSTASKPITVQPEDSQAGERSTGYFQALALQQFLEQYAEAKKNPANAGWRLVFDIPKQNQSLVVSPIQFTWQQNVNKPAEINFSMQFKAWRRINLKNKAASAQLTINKVSPGLLQTLLNTISAARVVMAKSYDLINAVRSDAGKPLEVLRQTSLLLKDGAGVAMAASDLPKQIARDYKSPISDYLYTNRQAIAAANANPDTRRVLDNIVQDRNSVEGLNSAAISSGQVGSSALYYQNASPSNEVFEEPDRYFEIFDAVPTGSLTLTTNQQNEIANLLDEAREITVDDLREFRNVISDLSYQISNHYGASTDFYSQVYNKAPAQTRTQPLGLEEYEILNALYGVVEAFDVLTATSYYDDINKKTNMEYVAGLADSSNIAFSVPSSKIVVPVPYGLTIEGIASRYFNDPQKWLEIVTLNNLREPYIDETGFQKPLLSNGIDRQITVRDAVNLYIGQAVTIKSATAIATSRRILGIDVLSETSVLLTLDGAPDLNAYTLTDKAYLQAYLPGTTNSQQKIFIPSDLIAQEPDGITTPAAVAGDAMVGLSKVDFLMTEGGDFATNNYGDFRLSAGLTNLIQALKIKMGTVKGTMISHPEFGLGIRAGMSTSEFTSKTLYDTINKLIKDDPRFGGIKKLQIQINKASLTINLSVFLANGNGVLPLTFDLKI